MSTTFLFVHGAWHGGWCWRATERALQAKGHETHAPTLTGLGERLHLAHAGITPDSHVEDILAVIKWRELNDIALVGHSYGGPVVVRAAIDNPDLVDGVIIVAGSVDPDLEETKWYQIPVHYRVLSWILPKDIYATNEEILALKDELQMMSEDWDKITQPVSIIQGGKDILVPAANADYAEKMLINTTPEMVLIPEMDHFIPWTDPHLIVQEIKRIGEINQQKKSPTE